MEEKSKINVWRYVLSVFFFGFGFGLLMVTLDISLLRAFFTALGLALIFMAGLNVLMFLMEDVGKNG